MDKWMRIIAEGDRVDTTHELHFPCIAHTSSKINVGHENAKLNIFTKHREDVVNNTMHGSSEIDLVVPLRTRHKFPRG